MKTTSRPSRSAFSLLELIIVIAVIAIIATFTMPALNTVLKGSHLSQAAGLVVGQLNIARQQAIARNREVEVRFYRFADPEIPGENVDEPATGAFRAIQIFELRDGIYVPADKMQRLPGSIIFSHTASDAGLSSILDGTRFIKRPTMDDPAAPRLPRGVDLRYQYVGVRFRPDGSTNLLATGKWFVTIVDPQQKAEAPNRPPPNFFTIQIDPVSGTIRNYRPTAG